MSQISSMKTASNFIGQLPARMRHGSSLGITIFPTGLLEFNLRLIFWDQINETHGQELWN